jgi:DNA-binding transcriptional regulator YhcF (GntR family)
LARVFAINPATAAKGVNRLVDEGLLYKRRGIGMFVAEGAAEALRRKRQTLFAQEKVTALVREAQNLGLSRAELLAQIDEAAAREGLE